VSGFRRQQQQQQRRPLGGGGGGGCWSTSLSFSFGSGIVCLSPPDSTSGSCGGNAAYGLRRHTVNKDMLLSRRC
jgi:hypothetical protein